ncbi:MAG TPA: trigger factor [Solirubrobacterales bacterium]|nr:trigger factor [Solirubrobacterales bacterium]
MKTSVQELPDSRVRVDVDVDADDVDRRVERAARGLGGELRVPGFRKGKVPAQVVIQRVGRDAVMEEALREALPEWYERALLEAGVTPVGDPKLDVSGLPQEGEPLSFSIEVAVRPKAKLGEYKGLEVGKVEPEVPEEAVSAELERLRDGFASLKPVEREAREGDFLLVDYHGEIDGEAFEGGEAHDFLLELGAEGLLEGFDEALTGAKAGNEREVEVRFPDDYRPERLAGKDATFKVEVKEVREKELPGLDDDFAAEASEFETLDELRENIVGRIREALERRAEDEFRGAAVDAAVAQASVEVPEDVVTARATDMWERVERSLQARGIAPDTYLRMQNRSRDELIAEARPEAEQALKREAVLAAIADAEPIEVSDEELVESLRHTAEEHENTTPEKLLERLRSAGRDSLLREEMRLRKAADVVAESAKPIPKEQADAREKLWTPDKEKGPEGGLWTPEQGDPDR